MSTRPIIADTEDAAWAKARGYLDTILAASSRPAPTSAPNVGSQRLLDLAARDEVFDRCLWTPLAAATGARGNSTALVGTPDTVAEALADYVDIGATHAAHPRLRAARRRRRLRPRADPAGARDRPPAPNGPAGHGHRHGLTVRRVS